MAGHARWVLLSIAVTLLGACGDDRIQGDGGDDADVIGASDITAADAAGDIGAVEDAATDVPFIDVPTPDISKPDITEEDGGPDATDTAEGGGLGDPCEIATDCASGHCVAGPNGLVCSEACTEGSCPAGWDCVAIEGDGTLCVPRFGSWCRPCHTDDECMTAGTDGQCIPFGDEGAFCGAACDVSEDCPDGASCQTVEATGGATVKQCMPDSGVCACNAAAIADGATTWCNLTNDAGTCGGTRSCTAAGLSECAGTPPDFETCNGQDDDCDGVTDEDLGGDPCALTNEHGECPGTTACVGGEDECSGAEAEAERCNGADDDCDGATDEDWPDLGTICDGPDADECPDGVVACAPDESSTLCEATGPTGIVESCNGVDDDCDGATDEDWPELGAPCDGPDADLCENGARACSGDGSTTVCGAENPVNLTEACNGADDDCDGATDEDWPELGTACDGPDPDECATGKWACGVDGATTTCANEAPVGDELCNGVDDDCDGETDENWPELGVACDGPDDDQCANGVVACAAGGAGTECGAETATDLVELCNGADDDCDGQTDEDWPTLGQPCDGPDADLCETGTVTCATDGAGTQCANEEPPSYEVCDGKDNDCDGTIDEGCKPAYMVSTFVDAAFVGTTGTMDMRVGVGLPVVSTGGTTPGAQLSAQLGLHAMTLVTF